MIINPKQHFSAYKLLMGYIDDVQQTQTQTPSHTKICCQQWKDHSKTTCFVLVQKFYVEGGQLTSGITSSIFVQC